MMKKMMFILAAAPFVVCSCGGGKGTTAHVDGMTFDSVVTDTTVRLANDGNNSPSCHIRLNIQYAKGDERAARINDSLIHSGLLSPDYLALGSDRMTMRHAVDSFVRRYVADYQKVYAPLYKQDGENLVSYNAEYLVSTRTQNGRDKTVIYLADVYVFGGGAHGSQQTIVKNIDTENGRILKLDDVFAPGYEQGLCDRILEQMCDKYDANDLDKLREKGLFMGLDVYPTDNFILGKDNITFIYVEDEIAPHAVGEIRVAIPYSDLKHILK